MASYHGPRSYDAKMTTLKNLVKALRSEMPPELLRKRSRSKTVTPRSKSKHVGRGTGVGGSSASASKGAGESSKESGANKDLRDTNFPTDDGTSN